MGYTAWVAACVAAFAALGGPSWQRGSRLERAERWSRVIVDEAMVRDTGDPTIDPLAVVALVMAESSGLAHVTGALGEIGLMQLMPWGPARRLEGCRPEALADPVVNLRAGIRAMRRYGARCGQGTPGAIAWHNLGRCADNYLDVRLVRRTGEMWRSVRHLRPQTDLGG